MSKTRLQSSRGVEMTLSECPLALSAVACSCDANSGKQSDAAVAAIVSFAPYGGLRHGSDCLVPDVQSASTVPSGVARQQARASALLLSIGERPSSESIYGLQCSTFLLDVTLGAIRWTSGTFV